MADNSIEVRSALKSLGIDISRLSNAEFNSILAEAEKLAPNIVTMLGKSDSENQISEFLTKSNSLKNAANNIGRNTESTRLAHLAPKANISAS